MTWPPVRTAMSSQHGLSAVAEAGGFYGRNLEAAAQLVDDKRREYFARRRLGHDDEWAAGLHHGFKERQDRPAARRASSRE